MNTSDIITKDAIGNIIANNRRPFAVHQIWAEMDRLNRKLQDARGEAERNRISAVKWAGMYYKTSKAMSGGGPYGNSGPVMTQTTKAGMTLRDWFAGQALQQFVAERDHNVWAHERYESARIEIARAAYNIADAMIAARKGTK